MRYQIYGFTISFLVHAAGIFLLITFCQFMPVETKTLLIDFSTFSVPRPAPVPKTAVAPVRTKSVPPLLPEKKIVKEKPPVPIAKIKPAKKKKVKVIQPQSEVKAVELLRESEPEPAVAAKVMGTKIVKEKPPVPIAKIKPAKRKKTIVIQPQSEVEAEGPLPDPEPKPAVASEITGPAPDPTPRRMANSAENLSSQVASEPMVSDGPTGTAAGPSLTGKKEYIKAHFLYIKEDIEKKITYPRLARKMGWEGKVVVSFVIRENGTVTSIKIVKSSGFTLLDKNAVESIKKAVPFPNPPVRAELVVPISYRLS